jgi:methyltransferase
MRILYPAVLVAMLAEGAVRGTPSTGVLAAGIIVFALAKLVKWSAILALGRSWTFRVVVVPGDRLVTTGPYRYLRHPNYLGVVGELAGVALMTGAFFSGSLALLVFGALLLKRIAVEERALKIQSSG